MADLSTILVAPLLFIIAVPYLLLHIVLRLPLALLAAPRFVYRWFIHRSVLESRYHTPNAYALISGASDGLGKKLAQTLAARGWNLILHGRNPLKLDDLAEELKAGNEASNGNIDIRLLIADCTQPGDISALFSHNLQDLRGPITVLFNNAGYLHPQRSFKVLRPMEIETTVLTNVMFPSLLTHRWLEPETRRASMSATSDENTSLMAQDSPKAIINISSVGSVVAAPGAAVYGPSKAYLTHFSRHLLLDLSKNVEVLNVEVGPMDTGMWVERRSRNFFVSRAQNVANTIIGAVGMGIQPDALWWGFDILGLGPAGDGGDGVYASWMHELVIAGGGLLPDTAKAWVAGKVYEWIEWEEK